MRFWLESKPLSDRRYTTPTMFLDQNVFHGFLHQTEKWELNTIPTLQHAERIDEHYGIQFPKCHHAAASAYEGRKRGGKPVNITGNRLCCAAFLSLSVVTLIVDCINEPFQTKPKSPCNWESVFPIRCTDFGQSALAGGEEKFLHRGPTTLSAALAVASLK
jgi:hypothetical protein